MCACVCTCVCACVHACTYWLVGGSGLLAAELEVANNCPYHWECSEEIVASSKKS